MTLSRQAKRALHTGSKAWRLIRDRVLVRDAYTCQVCKRLIDASKEAHVDHRDGDSHNNAMENLQTLCVSCHTSKTNVEDAGFGNAKGKFVRKGCNENGIPFDAKGW